MKRREESVGIQLVTSLMWWLYRNKMLIPPPSYGSHVWSILFGSEGTNILLTIGKLCNLEVRQLFDVKWHNQSLFKNKNRISVWVLTIKISFHQMSFGNQCKNKIKNNTMLRNASTNFKVFFILLIWMIKYIFYFEKCRWMA